MGTYLALSRAAIRWAMAAAVNVGRNFSISPEVSKQISPRVFAVIGR
jgi:hypothetical protein